MPLRSTTITVVQHPMPTGTLKSNANGDTKLAYRVIATSLNEMVKNGNHLQSAALDRPCFALLRIFNGYYESNGNGIDAPTQALMLKFCQEIHAISYLEQCTKSTVGSLFRKGTLAGAGAGPLGNSARALRESLSTLLGSVRVLLSKDSSANNRMAENLGPMVGDIHTFREKFMDYIINEYLKNGTTTANLNEAIRLDYETAWNNANMPTPPYVEEHGGNNQANMSSNTTTTTSLWHASAARAISNSSWSQGQGTSANARMVARNIHIHTLGPTGSVMSNNKGRSMSMQGYDGVNVDGNIMCKNKVSNGNAIIEDVVAERVDGHIFEGNEEIME